MDLLIDVGSTNIKWKAGGEIFTAPFPSPCRDDPPYFEVPAERIADAVKNAIEQASPERVFLSVQMHGYVLLKEGKAVTEYVSWRDRRGQNETPKFTVTSDFGVSLKPNLPRLSVQTQACDFDEFCTLGSYLVYRLTGRNCTHVTDFAPTGFYNVKNMRAVDCAFRLPHVTQRVERAGCFGKSEIFTPVGDQQAAVFGAARGFDGLILNLGTAGQLCCIEEGFAAGDFESRPFFGEKTLCTVTGLPAGEAIAAGATGEQLYRAYSAARNRLPARSEILVTGGAARYARELLDRVLNRLRVRYSFYEGCDALDGLEYLAKGEKI